jgi:broad-specificity NMP kinase
LKIENRNVIIYIYGIVKLYYKESYMHKLIILRGNSGSGKTTVSKELQKKFGKNTMYISQDIVRRYFDIPFEETVRRHQMRDKCNEFGAEAMRKWWREKDYSDVLDERIIGQEYDKNSIVNKIYCDVMGV